MKYKVEFSLEARNDLKDIIKYIKIDLEQKATAECLSEIIKEKIRLISDNPKIYSIINEKYMKQVQIRKIVVNNYLIFYKVLENDKIVQIIRILYGRRNWIKIIDDK